MLRELGVGSASNSIPNPHSAAAKPFQVNNHPTLLFHSVLSLSVSLSSISLCLSLPPPFLSPYRRPPQTFWEELEVYQMLRCWCILETWIVCSVCWQNLSITRCHFHLICRINVLYCTWVGSGVYFIYMTNLPFSIRCKFPLLLPLFPILLLSLELS